MSTVNIFELRQRFRKSVECFWRYRIFAGTVYRLKVKKFQILSMRKNFNLSIAKVKYLRSWNLSPEGPPSTSSSWGQDLENRLNTFGDVGFLLAQWTDWNWKISNLSDAQHFHLAITTVKYLRTWNFSPECSPSTFSSWGKDFENRLNTFGDIGFFLAQCTG